MKNVCINRVLAVIFAVLFLHNCSDDSNLGTLAVNDFCYLPLRVGAAQEYVVEDIQIDVEVGKNDTFNYMEKNIIVAEEKVALATMYIVDRYTRDDSLQQWQYDKTFHIRKQHDAIVYVEDNISCAILELPVQENLVWNYNMFNSRSEMEVVLDSLHMRSLVLEHAFDSTATISSEDFETLYSRTYLTYKLAKDVGLVYFLHIDVESQFVGDVSPNFSLPLMKRLTKGRVLKKMIVKSADFSKM